MPLTLGPLVWISTSSISAELNKHRNREQKMLGFATALECLKIGREAFFISPNDDLPIRASEQLRRDDLVPQFGYVGSNYTTKRVLFLGINPGNGPRHDRRTVQDARMMPILARFADDPTPENFVAAQAAYQQECVTWPVWTRHCAQIFTTGLLALNDIAYSNALPWRTASESRFNESVARATAQQYLAPLLAELKPSIVLALGKKADAILDNCPSGPWQRLCWNRAQALTPAVKAEREATAETLRKLL